jgi:hypothetical protein
MGLFGKKEPLSQPPRPAARTIPTLEPNYFESIHARLVANGGSDTSTEIAYGVGNAIYNSGLKFLDSTYATKAATNFRVLYEDRSPRDRTMPDKMIDFLVAHYAGIQSGSTFSLMTRPAAG